VNGANTDFAVRLVHREDPNHSTALHLALSARPPERAGRPDPRVAGLLADSRDRSLSIELLVAAFQGEECLSAALAVESPGRAALVFVPEDEDADGPRQATIACLQALQRAARERRILLLEMLLPPDSERLAVSVRASGFRYLTRLLYLRRTVDPAATGVGPADDLRWVTYGAGQDAMFAEAVERTYAQSLDCPELTGLRPMSDVLAAHRAAGVFDPTLWSVALRRDEPVAVLLLNRLPRQPAMEIVYMGVAQVARGTGVANDVLRRAVDAAGRWSATSLALAVDQRNTPARRVYARWGFAEFAARDAWIVTSPPTEG
jgi:mycothiol synthase